MHRGRVYPQKLSFIFLEGDFQYTVTNFVTARFIAMKW